MNLEYDNTKLRHIYANYFPAPNQQQQQQQQEFTKSIRAELIDWKQTFSDIQQIQPTSMAGSDENKK